jgi:hypothetical protein
VNNPRSISNWLFNPFIYLAGWPALSTGIVAILIAGYLGSLSRTHFDGVLDVHTGGNAPLWFFLIAGIMNWLCMSIACCVISRIASKKRFRLIDVFGTQAFARWPSILAALATLMPGFKRFTHTLVKLAQTQKIPDSFNIVDATVFTTVTVIILITICWMVRLMYKGFQISCDPKKERAMQLFIAALLLAEIASKVAIVALMKQI